MIAPLPINWPGDQLIPAVIQDASSHDVLMIGFMNPDALEQTRKTGFVHFWSRSRQKLWKKGETSGHVQRVENIYLNCEQNSLLIEVDQAGAVCHDGYPTCFYRRLNSDNSLETVRDRWFDPADVYRDQQGIQGLTARWWGAYEFLKQENLESQSGTSRAIRGRTSVLPRIQDELSELAGVLDDSHVHTNQHDDTILEASQVCYWIAVEAIRTGMTQSEVRPDRALDHAGKNDTATPATVAVILRAKAASIAKEPFTAPHAHEVFSLVAAACASLGIETLAPIHHDLDELTSRDYLEPYFNR